MTVMIDANVFCAYANSSDVHHNKAIKIINSFLSEGKEELITLDYVFDEVVAVALRRSGKITAVKLGNSILNSKIILMEVDDFVFRMAWKSFQNTNNLSFTDSVIVSFMEIFGISKIVTFDKHFKKLKGIKVIDN
jgi:predicted nucleic acid-binding protein